MPTISVVNKIMVQYSQYRLTLYGIFTQKEKIIINKSIIEWEFSKNETNTILSLLMHMYSTTNAS